MVISIGETWASVASLAQVSPTSRDTKVGFGSHIVAIHRIEILSYTLLQDPLIQSHISWDLPSHVVAYKGRYRNLTLRWLAHDSVAHHFRRRYLATSSSRCKVSRSVSTEEYCKRIRGSQNKQLDGDHAPRSGILVDKRWHYKSRYCHN